MFGKRIPFEMAPPGTDPTNQYNPLPKRRGNLKDAMPWIVGLMLFAFVGYRTFISPSGGKDSKAAQETTPPATATATIPAPTLTHTPTLSPTAFYIPTPTYTPTPTIPPILSFGVFVGTQQIACWCDLDTGEIGGDVLELCRQSPPMRCRRE
jgi:hypothetical protein